MIVSHPARVLFVHVHRTGGSTVQSLLLKRLPGAEKLTGLPGAKHAHLRAAMLAHPEVEDYWVFGFVRNPWARLWSWWSTIERRRETGEADSSETLRTDSYGFWSGSLEELPDFESFVMHGPDRFELLRTPQLRYVATRERRADFVGRTETLAADLAHVCDRLGIDPPAEDPHRTARLGSTDYRERYTPEMRRHVEHLFASDIREFGYEF